MSALSLVPPAMIRVITAPQEFVSFPAPERMTFMAGGIGGTEDWQSEYIFKLKNRYISSVKRVLINPRRDEFDVENKKMTEDQIAWEYKYLRKCNEIVFWFPPETLCPITLFELGSALERLNKIAVGCHPEYKRKDDLMCQLRLIRPDLTLVHTLDDLVTLSL